MSYPQQLALRGIVKKIKPNNKPIIIISNGNGYSITIPTANILMHYPPELKEWHDTILLIKTETKLILGDELSFFKGDLTYLQNTYKKKVVTLMQVPPQFNIPVLDWNQLPPPVPKEQVVQQVQYPVQQPMQQYQQPQLPIMGQYQSIPSLSLPSPSLPPVPQQAPPSYESTTNAYSFQQGMAHPVQETLEPMGSIMTALNRIEKKVDAIMNRILIEPYPTPEEMRMIPLSPSPLSIQNRKGEVNPEQLDWSE